jgi:hypothetical protein
MTSGNGSSSSSSSSNSDSNTALFSTESMDGMNLLEVTRKHIHNCLDAHPFFVRLTMYFSIRSKPLAIFQNGTKVAYSGNAYFTLPSDVALPVGDVATETLLCFMGKNESNYVNSLHTMGWDFVQQAKIMNIAGDMFDYSSNENGDMVVVVVGNSNTKSKMGSSTSRVFYLTATIVPLSVVFLLFVACCLYTLCNNVAWRPSKQVEPESPMWYVRRVFFVSECVVGSHVCVCVFVVFILLCVSTLYHDWMVGWLVVLVANSRSTLTA